MTSGVDGGFAVAVEGGGRVPAGVDMVVDNIGGDAVPACLEAMNVGGRAACTIGRMSGVHRAELNIDKLAERRLHLYGVSNRPAQRRATRRIGEAASWPTSSRR